MSKKKEQVFVALGGNIGPVKQTIAHAMDKMQTLHSTQHFVKSSLYHTTAVGRIAQPNFINAVVTFQTTLSPYELHTQLQLIERSLGKKREMLKNGPRAIDLDLLFYGVFESTSESLTLPHPRWKERLFVLQPLSDIVSEIKVGEQKFNINQLIKNFENTHQEKVTKI